MDPLDTLIMLPHPLLFRVQVILEQQLCHQRHQVVFQVNLIPIVRDMLSQGVLPVKVLPQGGHYMLSLYQFQPSVTRTVVRRRNIEHLFVGENSRYHQPQNHHNNVHVNKIHCNVLQSVFLLLLAVCQPLLYLYQDRMDFHK